MNEEGRPEKTNNGKIHTLDENVEDPGGNDDDVVEEEEEEKGRVIAIVDLSSDDDVDKEGEENNIALWQPWQGFSAEITQATNMPHCTTRRKDREPVNNSKRGGETHEPKSTITTTLLINESLMGTRRDEGANRNVPEEIPTESKSEEAPRESHNNTRNIIHLGLEDLCKENPLPFAVSLSSDAWGRGVIEKRKNAELENICEHTLKRDQLDEAGKRASMDSAKENEDKNVTEDPLEELLEATNKRQNDLLEQIEQIEQIEQMEAQLLKFRGKVGPLESEDDQDKSKIENRNVGDDNAIEDSGRTLDNRDVEVNDNDKEERKSGDNKKEKKEDINIYKEQLIEESESDDNDEEEYEEIEKNMDAKQECNKKKRKNEDNDEYDDEECDEVEEAYDNGEEDDMVQERINKYQKAVLEAQMLEEGNNLPYELIRGPKYLVGIFVSLLPENLFARPTWICPDDFKTFQSISR